MLSCSSAGLHSGAESQVYASSSRSPSSSSSAGNRIRKPTRNSMKPDCTKLQSLPAGNQDVVPMEFTQHQLGTTSPLFSINPAVRHLSVSRVTSIWLLNLLPFSRTPGPYHSRPSCTIPTAPATATAQRSWTRWSGPPCLFPSGLVQNPGAWPLR